MSDGPKLRIVSSLDSAETLSDGGPAPAVEPNGSDKPGAGSSPPQDPPEGAGGDGNATDMDCAWLPRTDLGNAQRFVRRNGHDFLFVPEWGWLAWDGRRWNAKEADAILSRAVHQAIKDIAREAQVFKESGHDVVVAVVKGEEVWLSDKLKGWCLASQGNAHVSCVAKLAQAYLTASPDDFDADPVSMNVANGTLRFAKVEEGDYVSFHPHRRSDRMTKISEVAFDKEALSPLYDAFLARIQPRIDSVRHLHAWGGVSLTGLQIARLHFWHGTGRNGKSTLIDCWAHVMGDYSQTIPIESFLDQGRSRRGGEASPDIAALPGIRCLRTSEPEKGAKIAESLVKLVTGGEPLRARHLNRDFFEFRPAFKLTMQGNYQPRVDGTDEGFWARILLVPFLVMIPEAERDAKLAEKLKGEASGILNRLLDGLRDYLDHGLSPTTEVIEATAEYRDDSDPIGRYLTECTVRLQPLPPDRRSEEERVAGADLYKLYVAWAKASGERPWAPKAFSRGIQDHGIVRLKSSGIWYRNLRLVRKPDDFEGMEYEKDPPKKP